MIKALFFLTCFFTAIGTFAQHAVGVFEDHLDIGIPKCTATPPMTKPPKPTT